MRPSQLATLFLVLVCALWAFSFPLLKVIERVGHENLPHQSSFFFSALPGVSASRQSCWRFGWGEAWAG
jgi:hypothetical protein